MTPSAIARLGYAEESTEIDSVITRLRQLAEDHPLCVEYEAQLTADNAAFRGAATAKQETEQQLTAVRFAVTTAKLENDRFREAQYGTLVTLLGKKGAESFFRK